MKPISELRLEEVAALVYFLPGKGKAPLRPHRVKLWMGSYLDRYEVALEVLEPTEFGDFWWKTLAREMFFSASEANSAYQKLLSKALKEYKITQELELPPNCLFAVQDLLAEYGRARQESEKRDPYKTDWMRTRDRLEAVLKVAGLIDEGGRECRNLVTCSPFI